MVKDNTKSYFNEPDLSFDGEVVRLDSLEMAVIHILVRKSPPLIYSLTAKQKRALITHIENSPRSTSATNQLLLRMLRNEHQKKSIKHVIKKKKMLLSDLVGKDALGSFVGEGSISRDLLIQKLQKMIFSEKSSFAQCGIFVSGAVQSVFPYNDSFNRDQLEKANVDIVLACIADTQEYPFLEELIHKVKGEVGRLVSRCEVEKNIIDDLVTKALHIDPDHEGWFEREVMIGDKKLKYKQIKTDSSNAFMIPLCPDVDRGKKTDKVKVYEISEQIAKKVVEDGGSRKALKDRKFQNIPKNTEIRPGQTMILELPCDIGPYDADLQTVCVDKNGNPLSIIHFPATFLDRTRTYPAGSNRVQVEIYNFGTKPIRLEDIYFRLRLYKPKDRQAREKWSLRKSLQYAEHKKLQALEYLIKNRVLEVVANCPDSQEGLGYLSNIGNLFTGGGQEGLLFYQHEADGTAENMAKVLAYNEEKITLENIDFNKVGRERSPDRKLIDIFRNICDVGREKRVIFVAPDNISVEKLQKIIEEKKVTDILFVPDSKTSVESRIQLCQLCKKKKVPITSIKITQHGTDDVPAQFELVGAS